MNTPDLEVRHGTERVSLTADETLVIGRNVDCGLGITDPRVSRAHVQVWYDDGWLVESLGEYGTFLDGQQIERVQLPASCTLTLAGPRGPMIHLAHTANTAATPAVLPTVHIDNDRIPAVAGRRRPSGDHETPGAARHQPLSNRYSVALTAVHTIGSRRITVGRAHDNVVVLNDLAVSRHHAEFCLVETHWIVRDLSSSFGTFVDGMRVTEAAVDESSLIAIGRGIFRLSDGALEEYQDTGAVSFGARAVSVEIAGRQLLDRIDFYLRPNSMLVIIGPSGSGKTTLLRALTGTRPADTGNVMYGGRDLYSNYEEIRDRIGFVPQDDILHPQLKVIDALQFAARLRFPHDTDESTRAQRVSEVITELGLEAQANQRVSTLSGGQRKRTSTAMELLTRPSLLFLDEPTSGLDINRDREVMRMLRELADAGRTVVVVSHNVGYVGLADRVLVLATGGHLAYYGRPADTLDYFGHADWADMYASLEDQNRPWREEYDAAPPAVTHRDPHRAEPLLIGRSTADAAAKPPRRRKTVDQFITLSRRYLAVIVADRQFTALLIATPLILAVFAHTVPGGAGLSELSSIQHRTRGPIQLLLVLVVGCCMMGTATSLREIVKERSVLARERTVGLSWAAYLASKVAVLAVLTAAQAIVLTLLGVLATPPADSSLVGPSALADITVAFVLIAVASMAIGLCVSAIVTNSDRALPVLVIILMAQLLFSGGLFPLSGRPVLDQLSWLSPARWGFAAGAAVSDAGRSPGWNGDPLWRHAASVYLLDTSMLVVVTLGYILVAALLVSRIGRLQVAKSRADRR